ncbi:hypothetical protein ACFL5J_00930 [Thermodesulfobacteriota bacterium]
MKPKNERPDISVWEHNRGFIRTRKGGWIPGKAVYNHGYSMMDDLIGKTSFFQVLLLNITGQLPERRLADWFEAVFSCMSYPDARIWCNQIGSLAGTVGASPLTGLTAGLLATDSSMYGVGPFVAGVKFIQDALVQQKKGLSVDDIVTAHQRRPGSKPLITGYVRPIASGDERIEVLEQVAAGLGFAAGEHLVLAREIARFMEEKFNEGMNLNGYMSAFLSDQGFSLQEILRLVSAIAFAGIQACHAEAADNPAGTFFPLQCEDIDYTGHGERPVPD